MSVAVAAVSYGFATRWVVTAIGAVNLGQAARLAWGA